MFFLKIFNERVDTCRKAKPASKYAGFRRQMSDSRLICAKLESRPKASVR
jgi:hypothetical protein